MPDHAPVRTFDLAQTLPGGFRFPARMTVLPLDGEGLALVSPIPIDDAMARELAALGTVRFLIAPNLLHHLYLRDAMERYPEATVLAPPGLRDKRPDLRIDVTLDAPLPPALANAIDVVRIEGAPKVDELVFFHRASRTLVVTDLVFHVTRPEGVMAHVVLFCVGCHGRLAQSRAWRFGFVKDRAAAARSAQRVLSLPTQTLIMAHGEIVRERAQERLTAALTWMAGSHAALATAP